MYFSTVLPAMFLFFVFVIDPSLESICSILLWDIILRYWNIKTILFSVTLLDPILHCVEECHVILLLNKFLTKA